MKRAPWWRPYKPTRIPARLEARPFPIGPVIGVRRVNQFGMSGVTMRDIAMLLHCDNGLNYSLLFEGLTVDQADIVAVHLLGKHPCEVWPVEWWSSCEADRIVDDILAREAGRTRRFVDRHLLSIPTRPERTPDGQSVNA